MAVSSLACVSTVLAKQLCQLPSRVFAVSARQSVPREEEKVRKHQSFGNQLHIPAYFRLKTAPQAHNSV
jgi:hypothetical protein